MLFELIFFIILGAAFTFTVCIIVLGDPKIKLFGNGLTVDIIITTSITFFLLWPFVLIAWIFLILLAY